MNLTPSQRLRARALVKADLKLADSIWQAAGEQASSDVRQALAMEAKRIETPAPVRRDNGQMEFGF